MQVGAGLPQYQSHKKVWALKIKEIQRTPHGNAGVSYVIMPDDDRYASFQVPLEYIDKHSPAAGGYYVVYDDGYRSYSPAKAFEEGYTLIAG